METPTEPTIERLHPDAQAAADAAAEAAGLSVEDWGPFSRPIPDCLTPPNGMTTGVTL